MKTNLAYIGTAAALAVESPVKKKLEVVGGLYIERDVPDEANSAAAGYAVSARVLKEKLELLGVEPIAVLPHAWWNRIADQAGLVTIGAKDSHFTFFDNQLREARKAMRRLSASFMKKLTLATAVGSWALFAGALAARVYALHGPLGASEVALAGAVGLLPAALTTLIAVPVTMKFVDAGTRFASAVMNGVESLKAYGTPTSGSRAPYASRFRLPDPPKAEAEIVLKLKNSFDLRIAADYSAFSFSPTPTEVLHAFDRDELAREEELRRQMRAADPIVYVVHGEAVAIVAQYGEFPIEQEVVDRVIASGF